MENIKYLFISIFFACIGGCATPQTSSGVSTDIEVFKKIKKIIVVELPAYEFTLELFDQHEEKIIKLKNFDKEIRARIGKYPDLNQQLVSEVKDELMRLGYEVTTKNDADLRASNSADNEIDPETAQLYLYVKYGYYAPGPFHSYRRNFNVDIYLSKSNGTGRILLKQFQYFSFFKDDYAYKTYLGLLESADEAVQGLTLKISDFSKAIGMAFKNPN